MLGLCAVVLCAVLVGVIGAAATKSSNRPFVGTLQSDPAYTEAESARGITAAMLELSWRDYEPDRGVWNENYIVDQRQRLELLLASDRTVTLALGLHYSPAWLLQEPDSRYVDETGKLSDELNVVFNQDVRLEVARYVDRVASDLGLTNFSSVRLTSGGSAELLYPDGGGYWAFDRNALGGAALPPSLRPNPLATWRPGQSSVPLSAVEDWAHWYVTALADVVTWQMTALSDAGFSGRFEVLTPGKGVQPRAYRAAVAGYLPRGLLGVGAVWDRLYAALPRRPDVVAYISSVADTSGGDDACTPADREVALDDVVVEQWSATRWISRIADEHDFVKRGENPGYDAPPDLNEHYRNRSPSGMMAAAIRQAEACGFEGLYWAHDEQLWDGTADLEQLTSWIRDRGSSG